MICNDELFDEIDVLFNDM